MTPIRAARKVISSLAAVVALAALAANIPAHATGPEQVTYLTEDYPPSNYLENDRLKGYAVDFLRAIWKRMGVPEQPVEVTNWARAFNRAESTPNTMLFAMTRNAERESRFQWVGPIYQNKYILVGRAGRAFEVAAPSDAAKYRVGVIREDIGHKLMVEAGMSDARLEKVADFRQLVKMLAADRVDLLCVSATLVPEFTHWGNLKPEELQRVLTVKEVALYYAFNKDTDPALVRRFQADATALDGERRRILKSFGLEP